MEAKRGVRTDLAGRSGAARSELAEQSEFAGQTELPGQNDAIDLGALGALGSVVDGDRARASANRIGRARSASPRATIDSDVVSIVLALDRKARRTMEQDERDPVRRDLIVDRAIDRLLSRLSGERPPQDIEAWFGTVLRNLWRGCEIPKRPVTRSLELGGIEPATVDPDPFGPGALSHRLREALPQIEDVLTARQACALRATLSTLTQKRAAVAAGMAVVDLRRTQRAMAARIRKVLTNESGLTGG